jgi:hypothetical protein
MGNKWGLLRETEQKAREAGIDEATGLHRTGLEEYLKVIFPNTNDWVHNSTVPNSTRQFKPDYRSENLKLIVEFDGLPHYQNPDTLLNNDEKKQHHESMGYKVVNIPYFIQLTNTAIKTLFGVDISESMFHDNMPSLNYQDRCSPAYLCPAGVERMAKEFKLFPEQYKTNVEFLKKQDKQFLTGVEFLETAYNAKGDKK